jgi:hypothetical protein
VTIPDRQTISFICSAGRLSSLLTQKWTNDFAALVEKAGEADPVYREVFRVTLGNMAAQGVLPELPLEQEVVEDPVRYLRSAERQGSRMSSRSRTGYSTKRVCSRSQRTKISSTRSSNRSTIQRLLAIWVRTRLSSSFDEISGGPRWTSEL